MRREYLRIIPLWGALFACGGPIEPREFPVDAAEFLLTVTKDGAGAGTVTSSPAGIDCGSNCSAAYEAGASVTLTATAAAGMRFLGWTGGGCSGTDPCTVTVAASMDVTAKFAVDSTIVVTPAGDGSGTVTSDPPAIDCGATCAGSFVSGSTVTLTATPAAGSTFVGWSGGDCTGTGPCTTTATGAVDVIATFALEPFVLTVVKVGDGAGTVMSTPAGINCGTRCAATFVFGQTVTLTAAPATGSTFTGWFGATCTGTGTCTTTMTAARAVTASFTRQAVTLSVISAGSNVGRVRSSPPGIDCPPTCSASFPRGTSVTLTATPGPDGRFAGWSGAGCTGTGTCTVVMTAPTTVVAMWTLQRFRLTVTKAGNGTGTVSSTPAGINCGPTCVAEFDVHPGGDADGDAGDRVDVHRVVGRWLHRQRCDVHNDDHRGGHRHGHVHGSLTSEIRRNTLTLTFDA